MIIGGHNSPNRSKLMSGEIEDLLDEAEEHFPESDFVSSVREWFDKHEFITVAQEQGLRNTANAEKPEFLDED